MNKFNIGDKVTYAGLKGIVEDTIPVVFDGYKLKVALNTKKGKEYLYFYPDGRFHNFEVKGVLKKRWF